MNKDLPIWLMEPELKQKQELSAWKLTEKTKQAQLASKTAGTEETKQRLKDLRERSRENIESLIEDLRNNLNRKYPGVRVKDAADDKEAVNYISEISGETRVISINNSNVVTQELSPGLLDNGFTVINSYLNEYSVDESKIQDYWDLPRFLDKDLSGTFEVTGKLEGIDRPGSGDSREYIAVLGVNAISAGEGKAFFLQHFHNILNDLSTAGKIVLVVGIDKIVENSEDADFQTKCMGIFGMENVTLSVKPKPEDIKSITDLDLPVDGGEKELHVIVLDNGRMDLLEGKFSDLFLCIGCRGCNKHCPIRHSFTDTEYIWTPKNYLSRFITGKSDSIDVCLHCEACRMECPVDIDIPHLMWQAKTDYVNKHGRSRSHKILGDPEGLAKLASPFAPIANLMMHLGLVRVPMESITGIDRKTTLPVFHSNTFRKWFKKNG